MEATKIKREPFIFMDHFPYETLEAFVAVLIIEAILDRPIDFMRTIRLSLVVGVVLTLLEYSSTELKISIKQGMQNGIGYFVINRFTGTV